MLQADIERARGGLHRLRAQQAAGEVALVTDVTSKQFNRCRRVRDQFLALAPRLSGVAIRLAHYLRGKNGINKGSLRSLGSLVNPDNYLPLAIFCAGGPPQLMLFRRTYKGGGLQRCSLSGEPCKQEFAASDGE